MIFEIAIGDRVRTVVIVRKGGLLHVELDGRTHLVDAHRVSESVVSMLVQLAGAAAPTRSIDAAFAARGANGDLDVHLDGHTIPVQIRPAGSFGRQKKGGHGAHGAGPQRVTAPMPGKVVRVLVKPGDEVAARQGLVVVEAMKMETAVRAEMDGVVAELLARPGMQVDAKELLAVLA